jgi:DNA-binding MarR family transcriptional regulator
MDPEHASGNTSNARDAAPRWTFVTNHFLVLASVARDPDLRVRDIAAHVGITERATQAILSDLVADGYIERIRIGRRNRYKIRRSADFRHPLVRGTTVGEVIDVVIGHHAASAVG